MGSFSLPATRAMELLFFSLIMQSVQETVWWFFFLLLPEGKGGIRVLSASCRHWLYWRSCTEGHAMPVILLSALQGFGDADI